MKPLSLSLSLICLGFFAGCGGKDDSQQKDPNSNGKNASKDPDKPKYIASKLVELDLSPNGLMATIMAPEGTTANDKFPGQIYLQKSGVFTLHIWELDEKHKPADFYRQDRKRQNLPILHDEPNGFIGGVPFSGVPGSGVDFWLEVTLDGTTYLLYGKPAFGSKNVSEGTMRELFECAKTLKKSKGEKEPAK